jgi:hypothetical protein
MPSIELPIRSLSILFIFGALVAILWFPDNPHTPDLARALFWWFLALGVVRWIESGLLKVAEDNDGRVNMDYWRTVSIIALLAQLVCLGIGVRYFYNVLSSL